MPDEATTSRGAAATEAGEGEDVVYARRWWILAVLGLAQLMIVLDITVVNIALPSAQKALHFSNDSREWIVTAYALAFGGLLLAGGRLGELFGRKRLFIASTIGFAAASAAGGAAQSFGMLVAARGLQGVFAALMAPAALSLTSTTFTDPHERATAFGIWGAIGGAGAAIGLLLGGVLTQDLSWRWTLLVNLAFAAPAALGAVALLRRDVTSAREPIDVPGTLTATAGLFALVYGFAYAQNHSWGSSTTIAFLAAGAVLLTVFVAIQARAVHPLMPLRVVLDRNRGGSYLALGIAGLGLFGVFLFATYYFQQTKGYSPTTTGLRSYRYRPPWSSPPPSPTRRSCPAPAPDRSSPRGWRSPQSPWAYSRSLAFTQTTPRACSPRWSWPASESACSMRPRPTLPSVASSPPTPASPRAWSTQPTRSAARLAWRCSAPWPRPPPGTISPASTPVRASSPRPRYTGTPPGSGGRPDSSPRAPSSPDCCFTAAPRRLHREPRAKPSFNRPAPTEGIASMGFPTDGFTKPAAAAGSNALGCDAFVFFDASSDVAFKQIFPALAALAKRGELDVPVIGVARAGWTVEQFVGRAQRSLEDHGMLDEASFGEFASLRFVDGGYEDAAMFERLREELGAARRPPHYLAIPPELFETVVGALEASLRQGGADHDGRGLRRRDPRLVL